MEENKKPKFEWKLNVIGLIAAITLTISAYINYEDFVSREVSVGTNARMFAMITKKLDVNYGKQVVFIFLIGLICIILFFLIRDYISYRQKLKGRNLRSNSIISKLFYFSFFIFISYSFINSGIKTLNDFPKNVNSFERVNGKVTNIFEKPVLNKRGVATDKFFVVVDSDSCFLIARYSPKAIEKIKHKVSIGDNVYLWYKSSTYKRIVSIRKPDNKNILEYKPGVQRYASFIGFFLSIIPLFIAILFLFSLIKRTKNNEG